MISRCPLLAAFAFAAFLPAIGFGQTATDSTSAATRAKADPAYPLIQRALASLKANDVQGAAALLDQGLALNPHSVPAHVLRGTIDASRRLLPQAEAQFKLAEADAPTDVSIKFYLADIKFAETDYAHAREQYAALAQTIGHQDLAAYNVFLCDLMGNQADLAARELAAFKQPKPQPSYYFANAAWCVAHKDSAKAQKWLNTAASTFPMPENAPYVQKLRNMGFLPLPAN